MIIIYNYVVYNILIFKGSYLWEKSESEMWICVLIMTKLIDTDEIVMGHREGTKQSVLGKQPQKGNQKDMVCVNQVCR